MTLRALFLAFLAGMVVAAGIPLANAQLGGPPEFDRRGDTVTISEGHSIHFEMLSRDDFEYAALAVLSEDVVRGGPLWFDDSFLHVTLKTRTCRGGVWAVPAGQPLQPVGTPIEDYIIADPVGEVWRVTKYNNDPTDRQSSTRKWAVAVLTTPTWPDGCYVEETVDRYEPDGSGGLVVTPETIRYNALLFFDLREVASGGSGKRFGNDPSPASDDDDSTRDGNSHAYNPVERGDHGPRHSHRGREVDLYWTAEVPQPSGNVVFENVRSGYHRH